MKQYICLRNRVILTKIRKTSLTLQTNNIKRANLKFKANIITNLVIYLRFLLKYLLNAKDILYIVNNIIDL